MNTYFVISRSADEPYFEQMTEEKLKQFLRDIADEERDYKFLDTVPKDAIECFPEDSALIIEGKIIVPKPKKVVTEFEL